MKSDGDLTEKEIATFLAAFSSRTMKVVKDKSFSVTLPKNVSADDLVTAAFDAVNDVQMECLRDQRINGQFGLKWIYTNCKDPVKVQVWPEDVRLGIQHHFKLVEFLVKIGHMSLMDQHQRRRLRVLAVEQADQNLKAQQIQLSNLRVEQKQQARLTAARDRLMLSLEGLDGEGAQAMLLKVVTGCQAIMAGMDGMDSEARERYMGGLSEGQRDQLADLEIIQQHFK